MRINVPYYSQTRDVADKEWQHRSCGIVSLAMILGYCGVFKGNIDELIQFGLQKGAYLDGVGWKHDGLISVARAHGVDMRRKEYTDVPQGISDIVDHLENECPVLVSMRGAYYGRQDSHIVCLVGTEKEPGSGEPSGLYYHDPYPQGKMGAENAYIELETFKTHWRNMALFPECSAGK